MLRLYKPLMLLVARTFHWAACSKEGGEGSPYPDGVEHPLWNTPFYGAARANMYDTMGTLRSGRKTESQVSDKEADEDDLIGQNFHGETLEGTEQDTVEPEQAEGRKQFATVEGTEQDTVEPEQAEGRKQDATVEGTEHDTVEPEQAEDGKQDEEQVEDTKQETVEPEQVNEERQESKTTKKGSVVEGEDHDDLLREISDVDVIPDLVKACQEKDDSFLNSQEGIFCLIHLIFRVMKRGRDSTGQLSQSEVADYFDESVLQDGNIKQINDDGTIETYIQYDPNDPEMLSSDESAQDLDEIGFTRKFITNRKLRFHILALMVPKYEDLEKTLSQDATQTKFQGAKIEKASFEKWMRVHFVGCSDIHYDQDECRQHREAKHCTVRGTAGAHAQEVDQLCPMFENCCFCGGGSWDRQGPYSEMLDMFLGIAKFFEEGQVPLERLEDQASKHPDA